MCTQVTEERSRAGELLHQMDSIVTTEAEAFELIEAALAKIIAQFTAVEQSHKELLKGSLAENPALYLNANLLEAGQAFAKEVMLV